MNDPKPQLSAFLKDKAGSVAADPRGFQPTMRRARRRRVAVGATAVVLIAVVLSGGAVLGRSLVDGGEVLPPAVLHPDRQTVTGDDWDGSITNEYPEIARGSFRDRRWTLDGRQAEIAPRVDKVELTFTIEGPKGGDVATMEVLPNDDLLLHEELALEDGSAHVVFGATVDSTYTIDAVLEDGTRHHAQIFTGYDSHSTITAQYYVLFLPAGADGHLYARDYNGVDSEIESIGDTPAAGMRSGPWLSGSSAGITWTVDGESKGNEICMDVTIGDTPPSQACFEDAGEPAGEGLLLKEVTSPLGVKALVGVLPMNMQDLRIERGDRSVSLQYELDPHPDLGFPFAVVVAADSHGSISAEPSEGGERVSVRF